MNNHIYNRPPKTFKEQVDLLKRRGLNIQAKITAERILENISYIV